MISEISEGTRKEFTGILTLQDLTEAVRALGERGVEPGQEVKHYLRVGPVRDQDGELLASASLTVWAIGPEES